MLNLLSTINDYSTEIQHPLVRTYPLVTFHSQLYLIIAYFSFVKILGPRLMKNRSAFKLRNSLIAYNFCQILINLYIFIEGGKLTYFGRYNFWCQHEEDPDGPILDEVLKIFWMTFISKWIDCLDTIFFVLRKKNNQISFLHLFHHGVMPLMAWVGLTSVLGGHCVFAFYINVFVHIIMYSYYMLSAFGPSMQTILNPYKKYLTILQMIQFMLVIVQLTAALMNGCHYKQWALYLEMFYAVVFLIMFCNFYKNAYMKKTAKLR